MTMPQGWINPKDFGAVGDGVTDDSDAFELAMNAFGPYLPRGVQMDGTFYIPPGNYYLAKDWFVSRGVKILGAAASGEYNSCLKFAPYKGIYMCRENSGPQQGDSFGAIIEGLRIQGGHPTASALCHWMHPTWEPNHVFSVGDKIVQKAPRSLQDNSKEYQSTVRYYECIKAGTSGPVEPIWETEAGPNYGVSDSPGISQWMPNTKYNWGSVVWAPGRFDVIFQPDGSIQTNPNIHSSATLPAAFLTAAIGDVVVDNGPDGPINWVAHSSQTVIRGDQSGPPNAISSEPVWLARKNAGIRVQARCTVQNCIIENFLNAGYDLSCSYASIPPSNGNGAVIKETSIVKCGGGIVHLYDDSSACVIQSVDIRGSLDVAAGYGKDVSKEFGIYDGSFLGNTYIGCQIAEVGGPHVFQECGTAPSTYVGMYTEGNCGPGVFKGGLAIQVGGSLNPLRSDAKILGTISYDDWRGVATKSKHQYSQGVQTTAILNHESYGSHSVSANDYTGQFGWIYNHPSYPGKWTLMGEANPTRAILQVNTIRSKNTTPHVLTIPKAYFLGESDEYEMLVTTGGSSAYDYNIRGGKRTIGDRDLNKQNAKQNSFLESVVIQDGYRGDANWNANASVATYGRAVTYLSNDITIERNGYVYRACSSGVTGVTQPTWVTVPSPYENIQIWNGPFSHEAPQACYKVGDYVRPRTVNGKVYQCSSAPLKDGNYYEGQIGSVEPTWPTIIGSTVVDGQLTWTCIGADTASYNVDGTAVWVCVGKVPVYGKSNFVHNEGTIVLPWTSGMATGYIDLGLLEDNNINVYKVNVRARNVLNATTASAYFQLNATYLKNGSTVTALEAPSVVSKKSTTGNAASWTAVLLLDTTTNHMRVKVTTNNTANTEFKAIREMF